ncbi:hypothetical protein ACV7JQ_07505 [Globicatella sulfidifaciens]
MKLTKYFILIILTILSSLVVYNVYENYHYFDTTQLGKFAPYVVEIYIKQDTVSIEDHLNFLNNISKEEEVTIVKNDIDQSAVLHSVILNPQSITAEELLLTEEGKNLLMDGQSFSSNEKLVLNFGTRENIYQPMTRYFANNLKSIRGTYYFVSNSPINLESLITKFEQFYQTPKEDLLNNSVTQVFSVINLYLIGFLALGILSFIIYFLMKILIPINNLEIYGIKKLLGYSRYHLFIEPSLLELLCYLCTTAVINLYFLLSNSYFPKNFWLHLLLTQAGILLLMIVIESIIIRIFSKQTLNDVLKGHTPHLKFFLPIIAATKIICTIVIGFLIFQYGALQIQLIESKNNMEKVADISDYVFVENFNLTQEGQAVYGVGENFLNNTLTELYDKSIQMNQHIYFANLEEIESDKMHFDYYPIDKDFNFISMNQQYLTEHFPEIGKQLNQISSNKIQLLTTKDYFDAIGLENMENIVGFFSVKDIQNPNPVTAEDIQVTIVESEKPIDIYGNRVNNKPWIIHISNNSSDMLLMEQRLIANTGPNSVVKFKNNPLNSNELKAVLDSYAHLVSFKFTNYQEFFKGLIDNYNQYQEVEIVLLLILIGLGFITTIGLITVSNNIRKRELAINSILGYKLVDQYQLEIILYLIIHAILLIVLVSLNSHTLLPSLIYSICDLGVLFLWALAKRKVSINKLIKSG